MIVKTIVEFVNRLSDRLNDRELAKKSAIINRLFSFFFLPRHTERMIN